MSSARLPGSDSRTATSPDKKKPGRTAGRGRCLLGRKEGKTSTRSHNSGSGLDSLSRKPDFIVATRRSEVVARLHITLARTDQSPQMVTAAWPVAGAIKCL